MDVEKSGGRIDLSLRERPKSEVVAFGKLMAALALMKSRDTLGQFQVELYEDQTADIPLWLLAKAVQKALDIGGWRPDPGDLLRLCEAVRVDIREAHKYEPCAQCNELGWETRMENGVSRVHRCGCWKRHQEKVAALGVGSEPLALPAYRGEA